MAAPPPILRLPRLSAALLLALASGAGPATAQELEPPDGLPRIAPLRLAEGERPEIDGVLDEPLWARAPSIGPLTQVTPVEGARPTKPTDVRMAYDADFLYLALVCFDDPALVRARQMDRDANVRFDDVVELWFDTFDQQQFAYWFQITPAGSRGDALLSDGGERFNKPWDGIWYGRARVTERGWEAEIALPFQTLSFREGHGTWGFNLRRKRKENDEETRWASPLVAYRFFRLSEGGRIVGLEGMRQGAGLDVVPYAKGALERDRRGDDDTSLVGDAGFDVRYRLTPSLTWLFTANTDFAETEVDSRQVNLTRFPLFFPEKRDFFLQDAWLFEFGSPDRQQQTVPFFSRTVGRDEDGEAVPILAGTKLIGTAGDWNLGVFGTLLGDHGDLDEQAVGVVRVSRNVGRESAVGAIVTGGDPQSVDAATTAGLDFRLGSSRAFGPGRTGTLWGYWMHTQTEGSGGEGHAWGLRGEFGTKHWEHSLGVHTAESGFDPKLGFVRRPGVRQWRGSTQYTWRDEEGGTVRRASWSTEPIYRTKIDGAMDSWRVPVTWLDLALDSEDRIEIKTTREFERVDAPFAISEGVTVPAADYETTRHELSIQGNDRRKVAGGAELEVGELYSGDLRRLRVAPILIPNRYFTWTLAYERFDVDLDEGDFTIDLIENRFDVTFTPDLAWRNLVQWDDDTESLALQSRLHWIVTPGHDLFLVGLFGWDRTDDGSLVPTDQEVVVKLSYTFRF